MRSNPTVEELESGQGYEKILELRYSETAAFVIERLLLPRPHMVIIWVAILAPAVAAVVFRPYGQGFRVISGGLVSGLVLLPLVLIPVHEALHLIPFRLGGARKIRIGADLSQGLVYVTAHRFVAGYSLFSTVALMPFIVITAVLAIAIAVCPAWWKWVLSMTMFVHSTMCAGDAALLSFMAAYKKKGIVTWDDADIKTAFFHIRKDELNG